LVELLGAKFKLETVVLPVKFTVWVELGAPVSGPVIWPLMLAPVQLAVSLQVKLPVPD